MDRELSTNPSLISTPSLKDSRADAAPPLADAPADVAVHHLPSVVSLTKATRSKPLSRMDCVPLQLFGTWRITSAADHQATCQPATGLRIVPFGLRPISLSHPTIKRRAVKHLTRHHLTEGPTTHWRPSLTSLTPI